MSGSVVIAGQDASGNLYPASADGDNLAVSINGTRSTFHYVAQDVTPVATATDVVVLSGSASKVIRVTKVSIVGTATAASIYDHYVIKRTTANTGGTTAALPLRVIAVVPETATGSNAYTEVLVKFNNHQYNGTTGLAYAA